MAGIVSSFRKMLHKQPGQHNTVNRYVHFAKLGKLLRSRRRASIVLHMRLSSSCLLQRQLYSNGFTSKSFELPTGQSRFVIRPLPARFRGLLGLSVSMEGNEKHGVVSMQFIITVTHLMQTQGDTQNEYTKYNC